MSKRILFVDDEPEWRLIPGTALRDAGYEVITAKDVFETGLQTYGKKLDLIILDVNLG
jgi:two-component system chemotaxis response regulator CheY